jgi:hypothetical protein
MDIYYGIDYLKVYTKEIGIEAKKGNVLLRADLQLAPATLTISAVVFTNIYRSASIPNLSPAICA